MDSRVLKLAQNGETWAMFEVANHLRQVDQNWKEALDWFTKAADLGYDAAQYEVGCEYKYGWHVDKNYEKAASYLTMAAEQDFKSALFELGGLYELGYGVEQNTEKAEALYKAYREAN